MSYKIGITGGIGSGKTTVCMVFEVLGVPVYYADMQAKRLMNTDPQLKASIAGYFGSEIYRGGMLDRSKLAEIVFNDKTALETLNSFVHPAVARDFEDWCALQTSPYVLEEAAIIFESDIAHRFDNIILVTAPDDIRIKRVCARDNVSPDTVRERMKNQLPEEKKIALAQYIIYNDNTKMIIPQVMEIHRSLRLSQEKQESNAGYNP